MRGNIAKIRPTQKFLLLIVLSAGILLLANCGKESCWGKVHNQHYPDIVKSYIDPFKNGNWWKYKCFKTNVTDSVYITDYHSASTEKLDNCERQDTRSFILHSDSMIYMYGHNSSGEFDANGAGNDNYSYLAFEFGVPFQYKNNDFENVIKIDSLKVVNTYYKDILKFTTISGKPFPLIDTSEYYFSKNIGLVRYINSFKDTFDLTDYEIK